MKEQKSGKPLKIVNYQLIHALFETSQNTEYNFEIYNPFTPLFETSQEFDSTKLAVLAHFY